MTRTVYRFTFEKCVALDDVESALVLARIAAEGVHGQAQTQLDACYGVSEKRRFCVVDATEEVGATIAKVLTALFLRTIGEDAFEVERRLREVDAEPLPRCDEARR